MSAWVRSGPVRRTSSFPLWARNGHSQMGGLAQQGLKFANLQRIRGRHCSEKVRVRKVTATAACFGLQVPENRTARNRRQDWRRECICKQNSLPAIHSTL